MKAVYKILVHFKIQTQTVYVKATGAQQAVNHMQMMHPEAEKVEFVSQVDPQHYFDIEV